MFLYCTVHSPACRIVQMRNLANTHVGTRNVLYGFCFLPLAPSDYIFRSSRYTPDRRDGELCPGILKDF